jgi:hypothetical protein
MSHFAHFTMAHLCPLGPRVRMNCSKLSALTTRGRFHGVSLDLLLFSLVSLPGATTPYFTFGSGFGWSHL